MSKKGSNTILEDLTGLIGSGLSAVGNFKQETGAFAQEKIHSYLKSSGLVQREELEVMYATINKLQTDYQGLANKIEELKTLIEQKINQS